MAADTRIFRISYLDGHVKYGNRITASGAVAYAVNNRGVNRRTGQPRPLSVTRVEATSAEATAGWADVTAEFLGTAQ